MKAIEGLLKEGQRMLDAEQAERAKMDAMISTLKAQSATEALGYVREALNLTAEEFAALGACFEDGNGEEWPYVQLGAFGCYLRVHVNGFDMYEPDYKRKSRELWLSSCLRGLRQTSFIDGPLGRDYVTKFVALAREAQRKQNVEVEVQRVMFRPFSYWKVYYAEWAEPVEVQSFEGLEQTEFVTVNGERTVLRVVRADEVMVNTPEELPRWAPVVLTPYNNRVLATPEWAFEESSEIEDLDAV